MGGGGGGGGGTGELSQEAEEASIRGKLERLTARTDLRFLNPPRRGSKLLVLDLDHTLIDFSCRFEFMIEQLKRPYLDRFLASCYRANYDIAIWSQTNWKWLELKLTELGMLSRKDYKISFALDKSSMFTVRANYIKPLQIIWNKFGDRWGPSNTIHVDDLARNFELNKQTGLLIAPFYLNPAGLDPDAPPPAPSSSSSSAFAASSASAAASSSSSSSSSSLPSGATTPNAVNIPVATNPANDRELYFLALYLVSIAAAPDFRRLDHSNWRTVGTAAAAGAATNGGMTASTSGSNLGGGGKA